MLIGPAQEAAEQQNVIALDDDDPEVMQTLFHFLYNFTYDDNSSESPAPFAVKVYAVADKYDIPSLRALAAQKLANVADPAGDLDDFIAAICNVDEFTSPEDSTLWDIVIPKIGENLDWLADNEKFFALVKDMPALNKKLLKRGAAKYRPPAPGWSGAQGDEDLDEGEPDFLRRSQGGGRGGSRLGAGHRLG